MSVTEEIKRKQEQACRAGERPKQEEGRVRGVVGRVGHRGAGGMREHTQEKKTAN